jgi:hypothetical protein
MDTPSSTQKSASAPTDAQVNKVAMWAQAEWNKLTPKQRSRFNSLESFIHWRVEAENARWEKHARKTTGWRP